MGNKSIKDFTKDKELKDIPIFQKFCKVVEAFPPEKLEKKTLLITAMGGSYNPVHQMHIEVFEKVRAHFEHEHSNVINVFGVLVATTDYYVIDKLENEAESWTHRAAMIRLACADKNWLDVYPEPEIQGYRGGSMLLRGAQTLFPQYNWVMRQICGADTAIKARLWKYQNPEFICCGREGYEKELSLGMAQRLLEIPEDKSNNSNLEGFLCLDVILRGISSTLVRKLLNEEKWNGF